MAVEPNNRLWWATLSRTSPNYRTWLDILGTDDVPLKSSHSVYLDFGPEKHVEAYLLDLKKLDEQPRRRLVEWIANRFGEPRQEIEAELDGLGFPIRAADVSLAFSIRAFL